MALATVVLVAAVCLLSGCDDFGVTERDAQLIWVGKVFVGGRQCTQEVYTPPDTKQLLSAAGIEVYATSIQHLAVCRACLICPTYAAMHLARIGERQLPPAEALGFQRVDDPTNSERITLSTDRDLYTESDTIRLYLSNNSSTAIIVGLRCGEFLEMVYQQKRGSCWSEHMHFWFESLRCPTSLETIEARKLFVHSLPAEWLGARGTFRLIVDYRVPGRDTSLTLFSNSFRVE